MLTLQAIIHLKKTNNSLSNDQNNLKICTNTICDGKHSPMKHVLISVENIQDLSGI